MDSNSITNSYKKTPSHLKETRVPLDFKSALTTVPDSFEWAEHDPVDTIGSVPVIHLFDPNAKALMGDACEKWGVFQAMGHGVPMNLLNQLELQTHQLFSLPTHLKLSTLRSPDGIIGYGLPRISCFFPKLMWTESFSIMGSPIDHATQLWPHQPNHQTHFCTVMEEYQKEMKRLTERILELMLGSLGLACEDVYWLKPKTGCDKAQEILHLNSYPVCPEPERAMGMGPHTDSSLVNLLYPSSCTPGLQVHEDGIGWVAVQPVPGAIVVNIGDLMQILTNGRFKSVQHQVVVSKTRHRFSVGYLYGPPSDVKISPLLIDDDHPPLYGPITWKEYLHLKSMHFNDALQVIENGNAR